MLVRSHNPDPELDVAGLISSAAAHAVFALHWIVVVTFGLADLAQSGLAAVAVKVGSDNQRAHDCIAYSVGWHAGSY